MLSVDLLSHFSLAHSELLGNLFGILDSVVPPIHDSIQQSTATTTAELPDESLIRIIKANPTLAATLLRLQVRQQNREGNVPREQTMRHRVRKTTI